MMQLKSMNSIVGGLERLYNAYLVKQNMLYISLKVHKKRKLLHHAYVFVKIGCN